MPCCKLEEKKTQQLTTHPPQLFLCTMRKKGIASLAAIYVNILIALTETYSVATDFLIPK